ncbi:hypothetical protein [Moorena sp. SIO4G3]|uniref:hypothetical protein n=1 Tax=Moorena sp. SIO4G3 TaxID=2607821 RepID=UPI00142B7D1F|nr:hypothetical protein [Moorena sp. SIO4G3]NEO82583.1 hypothetical protein [Moorena sp. SIO4G3]
MGRWGDGEMGRWGVWGKRQEARGKSQEFINYSTNPYSLLPTPYSLLPIPLQLKSTKLIPLSITVMMPIIVQPTTTAL